MEMAQALRMIRKYREFLTRKEMLTIRGQALAGDTSGAMIGLYRIINKKDAMKYKKYNKKEL